MSKKFAIPQQPEVTETTPGNITIDQNQLDQWHQDMADAHTQWKTAMQGAENDPDEILHRMLKMFGQP